MAKTPELKVKIVLDGVSQFQSQLRSVGKATADLGGDFQKLGGALADSAKKFALVAGAIVGVAASLVKLTSGVAESAEEIDNLAQVSGNSVEELQIFRKIAEDSGISGETAGKALVRLTKNMKELKDPTSATSKELDGLSPGLRKALLNAKDADERFDILRTTLSATGNETTAVNVATLLLGKSGADLLPVLQKSAFEYENTANTIRNLNFVLNEAQTKALAGFDEAMDNSTTAVQGLGRQLAADLAPQLTLAANAFTQFVAQNGPDALGLISLGISELSEIVRGFFILMSSGPEAQGVDERARLIYEKFILIRDAVSGAFERAIPILQGFNAALTPIAKLLGFDSPIQLGITAALLNFFGVFKIVMAAFAVGTGTVRLFFTTLGLGPAALKVLTSSFTVAAGLIGKVIFELQFAWLLALEKMGAAATFFSGVLSKVGAVARLMWLAITGPIGLAVIGFSLLGAGLALLIEKTIGWKNVFEAIGKTLSAVKDFALNTLIPGLVSGFVKVATTVGAALSSIFGGLLTSIGQLLKSIFDLVVAVGVRIFNEIAGFISNTVGRIVTAIGNVITGVFNAVKQKVLDSINFVSGLIDKATAAVNRITAAVKGTQSSANGQQFGPPRPPGFATGGLFKGLGSGTSDSNIIAVSNGEYIVKAQAVKNYGVGFMNALNNGLLKIRGFADGGFIEGISGPMLTPASVSVSGGGPSGRPLTLVLPGGGRISTVTDESTARKLERDLRRSDFAKTGKLPRWYS